MGKRPVLLGQIALFICFSFPFFLASHAFAQLPSDDRTISSSELAKDNLDKVAASESQINEVLNANPGLFVELKRWIAKDAADRGQILKDSDLTDASVLSRLASDLRFRAAATRVLQSYGYLLPKVNPDSEVGREHAALEQERIRELVATQQAQAQAQQSELAKCGSSSDRAEPNCQPIRNPSPKAVQTKSQNPVESPKDRDFDQLLMNPVPQPAMGNGSLLRTGANPLGAGNALGAQATSESDLALLPISYDRTALPDPDPPSQLPAAATVPTVAEQGGTGRSGLRGEALLENDYARERSSLVALF